MIDGISNYAGDADIEARCLGAVDVALKDAAHLLLDQARIMEGETLPDPTAYAKRMADVMAMAYRK